MKLQLKYTLLSIALLAVVTFSLVIAGSKTISDLAFQVTDQFLQAEISKIKVEISETLDTSGALSATLLGTKLQEKFINNPLSLSSLELAIFEPPDITIVHPTHAIGERLDTNILKNIFTQKEGTISFKDNQVSKYGVFTSIQPSAWLILLSVDKDEIYSKRTKYLIDTGFIILIIAVAIILLVNFLLLRFTRRIQTTLDCVQKIENGDLNAVITDIEKNDEISTLQVGVNIMSKKIRQRTLEQQNAEEHLHRYKNIIASTSDLMSFVDRDYTYLTVNKAYLEATEKKREEIVGKTVESIVGKDHFQTVAKKFLDRALDGKSTKYHAWFNYAGLGRRFLQISYYPYRDHNGEITGVVISSHDQTEIKKSAEKLQISEKQYRNIYDTAPIAILTWDANLCITDWNKHAELLFGWKREEVLGLNFFSFLLPDADKEQLQQILDCTLTGEELIKNVNQNSTKNGQMVTIEWNNSPLVDSHGHVIGGLSLGVDVTDKIRVEKELIREKEISDEIINSLPLIFTMIDEHGINYRNNGKLKELTGFAEEDCTGEFRLDFVAEHQREQAAKTIKQILNEDVPPPPQEILLISKEGNAIPYLSHSSKIEIDGVRYAIIISLDISKQKEQESRLAESKKRLRLLMEQSPLPIAIYDKTGLQTDANHSYEKLWGLPVEESVSQYNILNSKDVADSNLMEIVLRAYAGETVESESYWFLQTVNCDTKNARQARYLKSIAYPLFDESGEVQNIVIVHEDITELKTAEEEKERLEIVLPEEPQTEIIKGSESIMLVDDNKQLLETGQSILESLGYTVFPFLDPAEALEEFRSNPYQFDLVITDLTMPKFTGEELCNQLCMIRLDIPVILCSGFGKELSAEKAREAGFQDFLYKPLETRTLSQSIRSIFDQK